MTDGEARDDSRDPDPDELCRRIERAFTAAEHGGLPQLVREELDGMVRSLSERWIGGPWEAAADIWIHTTGRLEETARTQATALAQTWDGWCTSRRLSPSHQLLLFVYLWWKLFDLWDSSFGYRTIEAVRTASTSIVSKATGGTPQPGAELREAWTALDKAMDWYPADSAVFRQFNLSSPGGLRDEARSGVGITEEILAALDRAIGQAGADLASGEVGELALIGLRLIRDVVRQFHVYYAALVPVAGTLEDFDCWIADAAGQHLAGITASCGRMLPRLRTATGPSWRWRRAARDRQDKLLDHVQAALHALGEAQGKLSGATLSECEPWTRVLEEIERMLTATDQPIVGNVFAPARVWVRYCYPFAVEGTRQRSPAHLHPKLARSSGERPRADGRASLRERLQQEFDDALGTGVVTIGEPADLARTEFFTESGPDGGLFGGVRVDLPDLVFTSDGLPGSRDGHGPRCKVWLDLNRMGNFCLCIEPSEPMRDVPPPGLYRALRAGSPFVLGEQVALAPLGGKDQTGRPAWDNLQTFARDVIRMTADAYHWKRKKPVGRKQKSDPSAVAPFVSGNPHEVVIVQTDKALGTHPGDVASRLDALVGGRILLRPVLRTASTLDEWVRFPPLQPQERDSGLPVAAVPQIGYTGDWLAHSGGITVIGIVAVPNWLRSVYPETAQFASSWTPMLRLWSKRLQRSINQLRPDRTQNRRAEELRQVEQSVRLHLSQISSDELCATLAYRRFLDQLLDMAGVGRQQQELQAQLKAAEQLTDWYNEHQERRSGRTRDRWLFAIALLGIFSLADYMQLANVTHLHEKFGPINLSDTATWQPWFIFWLFVAALVGGSFVVLGIFGWLREKSELVWRRLNLIRLTRSIGQALRGSR